MKKNKKDGYSLSKRDVEKLFELYNNYNIKNADELKELFRRAIQIMSEEEIK